jgi:hypothetical protein
LGSIVTGSNIANDTQLTSAQTKTISTLPSIPPGIWILSFSFATYSDTVASTINNAGIFYNISTTTDTFTTAILSVETEKTNYTNVNSFPRVNGNVVVNVTSTTTYYLNVTMSFTGIARITTLNAFFKAIRIG